ncbi:DHH family phosphoesterase [Candidatus Woesearchaeota archaeon]|nr:DHH family phosphoesterase [Candidatus Woesearchaeota archaeon]
MVIYVIGHKNPDTDSVVSAISYAALKRELGVKNVKPARAGLVNEQTRWVLNYFKQKPPVLIQDISPKAKHLMTKKVIYVKHGDSLKKAIKLLDENNIRMLPVLQDGKPVGVITLLDFAHFFINSLKQDYKRLRELVQTKVLNACDKRITTCNVEEPKKQVMEKLLKSKHGSVLVLNNNQELVGVITKTNLLKPVDIEVILVDHNEPGQAVDGIEEVQVLEIIDHHRIATFQTSQPIRFINQPLGSTSTIIALLYKSHGLQPSKTIAGLLLAGLTSDTLCLRSSTTTSEDKSIAKWLEKLSGLTVKFFDENYKKIALAQQEKALQSSILDLLKKDFKTYTADGKTIGISAVEVVSFDMFFERVKDIEKALQQLMIEKKLYAMALLVTNILKGDSILICQAPSQVLDLLPWPELQEHVFELKGVTSRKKQVAPVLISIVEGKPSEGSGFEDSFYLKKRV